VRSQDTNEERKLFEDLPLCSATLAGLSAAFYKTMTPIQIRSLAHALRGTRERAPLPSTYSY
jgi:superfamily II DNA/RNA helicase